MIYLDIEFVLPNIGLRCKYEFPDTPIYTVCTEELINNQKRWVVGTHILGTLETPFF